MTSFQPSNHADAVCLDSFVIIDSEEKPFPFKENGYIRVESKEELHSSSHEASTFYSETIQCTSSVSRLCRDSLVRRRKIRKKHNETTTILSDTKRSIMETLEWIAVQCGLFVALRYRGFLRQSIHSFDDIFYF